MFICNFRSFFMFFALLAMTNVAAQEWHGKVGICVDFGNEVKRIGLRFDGGSQYEFVQANLKAGFYYNFSSWGIQSKTPEVIIGFGAHFGAGSKGANLNPFISLHDRNFRYNYSLGYVYQYYFDWQGTKQSSGMLMITYKGLSVLTENDLLGAGKGWRDRFRTGGVKISYRYDSLRFGLNLQLYTGDYASCTKITEDKNYPARFGYRSQDKSIYGDKSLGILSVQGEYVSYYSQSARIDIGVNSERIRHAVQNKGLHDMPFSTDKMVKRQLMHVPMLQKDGTIYTYKEGQEIKPAKLYYNLSLNPAAFY
ncbi:MAG: polymorphic toxin type 23 domain-containing protein [Crocinitomicaceae bacterium]